MDGHEKLLRAGFHIYRLNLANKTITKCAGFGRWNRFESYKTKAETKWAWTKLMEDPKNIGD